MAEEGILINSGTGPSVAVDLAGTNYYQIVKVVQAPSGTEGTLSSVFQITNTGVSVVALTSGTVITVTSTANVTVVNTLTATLVGTSNVSVVNTPTVTVSTGSITVAGTVSLDGTLSTITLISPSTIGQGFATVSTAGVAISLSTGTTCKQIYITALENNTGEIRVGGSGVGTSNGIPLVQFQSVQLDIDSVGKIYINASNSGDGVTYAYLN